MVNEHYSIPRIASAMMSNGSDRTLWEAVRNGDEEAFGKIFDRHANRIFSYCFQRTADRDTAQDLTSIVFLEAWRRRRDAVFAGDLVLAWLYGIALNVLRNQRRSQRRYQSALARLPRGEVQPDFTEEAVARVAAEETMRLIAGLVQVIPERERECLVLCTWQGLTSSEAAVALGVPPETVRSRLHRAHERLRKQLAGAASNDGELAAGEGATT